MDTFEANKSAWNEEVRNGNCWTRIVDEKRIEKAREGEPDIWVTPTKCVPTSWISSFKGKKVLNACGGGGQQTPTLTAYGADVTVLDLSPMQLEQDRIALERYGLDAVRVEGSVTSLPFEDDSFDHILNPCSLNFVEDLGRVYDEFRRVLKVGGSLILGIANPILYIFDDKKQEKRLRVKYTLPFSDTKSLSRKELEKRIRNNDTVEFSHTLQTILGGLTDRGFAIDGFFSDYSGSEPTDSFVSDAYFALRAVLKTK